MGKAVEHAKSSVSQWGGKLEDYLDIHNLLDSSRAVIGDVRHRMLTHNTWFMEVIIPRIFGEIIRNSEGENIPVRSIVEQHILEDYGDLFVPTPQDFAEAIPLAKWMNNAEDGEVPPSRKMMKGEKPVDAILPTLETLLHRRRRDSFRDRPCARGGRGVMD